MPRATFSISGDVTEFERVDNLYRSLKREGKKMLKNWTIDLKVEYSEKEGEKA
ncbi:MAG: hypothetical protein GH151_10925 [Bacteroidetes bacterium]|nr:hypothetical protein [Bacteroidota bacterium]